MLRSNRKKYFAPTFSRSSKQNSVFRLKLVLMPYVDRICLQCGGQNTKTTSILVLWAHFLVLTSVVAIHSLSLHLATRFKLPWSLTVLLKLSNQSFLQGCSFCCPRILITNL